mmetsp:Transcript_24407/g.68436  ORF Transcript_24407/g.68436 Transcript_24407/m.68436 type:complete len:759 (-) Transcript_24407:41-2317(-)
MASEGKQKLSGRLRVVVMQGANLAAQKWNGMSDPYAMVHLEQRSMMTKVVLSNLNPEWQQTFTFKVSKPFGVLEVSIFDKALAGSTDTFMGKANIPLVDLGDGETHQQWYKLGKRPDDDADCQVSGEILLELQFTFINSWRRAYEGVAAYKAKDYKNALSQLNDSIEVNPHIMEILGYRAATYMQVQKFDEAVADAEKIIEMWPNEAEGYYRMGQIYLKTNNYKEAMVQFEYGLHQDPQFAPIIQVQDQMQKDSARMEILAAVEGGRQYFRVGNYMGAISAFSVAIQKNEENPHYYIYRAIASMALDNYNDAKLDVMKSVELMPTWPKTDVRKQGYLKKEGELNRMLRRRWFVLNKCFLFYYKTSKDLVPTGVICLHEYVDDGKKSKWVTLNTPGRTFLLRAESSAEAQEWKDCLLDVTKEGLQLPSDPDHVRVNWKPKQAEKSLLQLFNPKEYFNPKDFLPISSEAAVVLTVIGESGYLFCLEGNALGDHLHTSSRNWQQRWFCIKDDILFCFEHKQVDNTTPVIPKVSIPLAGASYREVQRSEILGQELSCPEDVCIFEVMSQGKQTYLYAEKEDERAKWGEAIQRINMGDYYGATSRVSSEEDVTEFVLEEEEPESESESETSSEGESLQAAFINPTSDEDMFSDGGVLPGMKSPEPGERVLSPHKQSVAESRYYEQLGISGPLQVPRRPHKAPARPETGDYSVNQAEKPTTEKTKLLDGGGTGQKGRGGGKGTKRRKQVKEPEEEGCCDSCAIL